VTIGYYPGCSAHGTSREFEESTLAVAAALELRLTEIGDWSCCGASSAHQTNALLGVALPARNLALAEEQGFDEILTPCAACYNRLGAARYAIAHEAGLSDRVAAVLGRPFANTVGVRTIVEVLRSAAPTIAAKATAPLTDVTLASYSGCLLTRPATATGFDDPEQPTSMQQVVSACGATPVEWNMALECCGGAFSVGRTASVVRLSRAIIGDARRAGADAIVVACPMCHSNLDFRQAAIARRGEPPMPVIYITQLVGLALGLSPATLGLHRHFVGVEPLLERLAAAAQEVTV
jgi:heterodisulfide reductase subunit B